MDITSRITQQVLSVVNEVLLVDDIFDVLDVSIQNELAPTSLDRLTLFVALEDEFDRQIPQEEVKDIDTIRDVIAYIASEIKSAAA